MEKQRPKYGRTQGAPEATVTALSRSDSDMVCGVCLEVVLAKVNPWEREFGILPNCSHCYCVNCIRTWRTVKSSDGKSVRSCPECRTPSMFYIPSKYWVDDTNEKQKLVREHKASMAARLCRNFDGGRGKCRFGSRCFYKHVLDDKPVLREGGLLRRRRARIRLPWGWSPRQTRRGGRGAMSLT